MLSAEPVIGFLEGIEYDRKHHANTFVKRIIVFDYVLGTVDKVTYVDDYESGHLTNICTNVIKINS